MKIKTEKHLAVMDMNGVDVLSRDSRAELKIGVEQVIENPSVHTAILLFKGNQNSVPSSVANIIKQTEKFHGREKWEMLLDEVRTLLNLMENANVSWIAALQGPCLSHQLEIALACDYRTAAFDNSTVLGFPELQFGLIPNCGGIIRLTRLTGVHNTLNMILNSKIVSARTAYRAGLLNKITHPLDLEKSARALTRQISTGNLPPKPRQKYKPTRPQDQFLEIPMIRQWLYYRAKKKILAKTKNFHPAPLKVLEVIKNTYPIKSLNTALKEESDGFCDLIVSPVTKHLMSVYSALLRKQEQQPDTENTPPARPLNKTAVMGAGAMGEGITHWLANNHIPVLLKDIHAPSLSSALRSIHSSWNGQTRSGRRVSFFTAGFRKNINYIIPQLHNKITNTNFNKNLNTGTGAGTSTSTGTGTGAGAGTSTSTGTGTGAGAGAGAGANIPANNNEPQFEFLHETKSLQIIEQKTRSSKIRPQMDYSGFHNVDLIIETVVEDREIKKKVIAETAPKAPDQCLFATNTSSFSISELAHAHPDPGRFLGLHFFYPAHQTPLVEVVRGEQTAPSTIHTAVRWLKQLNKIPVIVKDSPGWLVHRLFLPLMSEALWLLREGAGIRQVDKIYSAFGFSAGPFRLMDELGLDICMKLIKSFQSNEMDFPEEFMRLRSLFLGRKNKVGFYIYNDHSQVTAVNHLVYQDLKLKPSIRGLPEEECLQRGLYRMVNEAVKVLEEEVTSSEEELNLALILGIGFPAFRGGLLKYADEVSWETILAGLDGFSKSRGQRFCPNNSLLKRVKKMV